MPTILSPSPTRGTGDAFGLVPGQLGLPDPFGDLNKVAGGGLGALNKNLLANLTANSLGVISPGTRNALAITNAQRFQGTGMPLSGLSTNDLFGNIAGFSEGLQKQAADQYGPLVGAMKSTQTVDPGLQTEIANTNALRGAAADPRAKFNLAKSLYDEYAAKVRGPAGGISFGPQPTTPKPLDFGSINVGGGGVGLGAGGPSGPAYDPSKFDWYSSTFGKPASTGTTKGPGNTFIGNPMWADEYGQDPLTSPAATTPPWTVGPGGLPGTEGAGTSIDDALSQAYGTYGPGGFGNVGDLFGSQAGQDIFSELV